MTELEQRIAIAEACGFVPCGEDRLGFWYWPRGFPTVSSRPYAEFHELPDYPNDLNAMHEAEKSLKGSKDEEYSELSEYQEQLYMDTHNVYEIDCIRATARQRAEAFLRTLGLWHSRSFGN